MSQAHAYNAGAVHPLTCLPVSGALSDFYAPAAAPSFYNDYSPASNSLGDS
jgi:hypothetical protein